MAIKEINLKFGSTTIALAGNPYGKRVFAEQVQPTINMNTDSVLIIIPSQIRYVTSSFIQGFFDYWLRNLGIEEIKKRVTIKAGSDRIVQYIMDNLY